MLHNREIIIAMGDGIGAEMMHSTLRVLQVAKAPVHLRSVEMGKRSFEYGYPLGIPPHSMSHIVENHFLLKAPTFDEEGNVHHIPETDHDHVHYFTYTLEGQLYKQSPSLSCQLVYNPDCVIATPVIDINSDDHQEVNPFAMLYAACCLLACLKEKKFATTIMDATLAAIENSHGTPDMYASPQQNTAEEFTNTIVKYIPSGIRPISLAPITFEDALFDTINTQFCGEG